MKHARPEIEAELRSLVPRSPSQQARDGIAGKLSASARPTRWTKAARWGAVAITAAASLLIAMRWWPRADTEFISIRPQIARVIKNDTDLPPPTWIAYQRLLSRSPEKLDEVLDRQAANSLSSSPASDEMGSLYRGLMLD